MKRADWGPQYIETNMENFPVEPWNTYSNTIFILLCLYIAWRTRLNFKKHPFSVFCLPFLCIGTLGGIVFHMTRSHPIWLFMDFVPIQLLCFFAVINLWRMIFKAMSPLKLWFILVFVGALGLSVYANTLGGGITVGYLTLGMNVILPFLVYLMFVSGENWYLVISAIASFACAVFFRWFDMHGSEAYFPMGSHFLWHVLGGTATWCLFVYFMRLEEKNAAVS